MGAKRLLPVLAAVLAIGALLWLVRQTQSVDVDRHNARLAQLRTLERLDGRLNEEVIKARLYLDVQSDALLKLEEQIARESGALKQGDTDLQGLSPQVDGALKEYLGEVQAKLQQTARFEPGNLQLINALEEIPAVSNGLIGALGDARYTAVRQLILNLRGELMTYGVLPQPTNAKAIEALSFELSKQSGNVPDDLLDDVQRLCSLSNGVLSTKSEVLELVNALLSAPTRGALERLQAAYGAYHQAQLAEADRYRAILAAYAGALLLALAWLGLRLRGSYRELDRANASLTVANETLEAQVEARTVDLSQALKGLRESQAQLVQSEKMASLGQMVAGVAHEINTPLAYARSNVQMLDEALQKTEALLGSYDAAFQVLQNPDASDAELEQALGDVAAKRGRRNPAERLAELRDLLGDSGHGLEEIAELVLNLKDFSRVDRSATELFDINGGIDSALKICHNQLKHRVEVVRSYGALPQIECSPSQLNQVFLNILTNASQAIGQVEGQEEGYGGKIYIHTQAEGDGVVARFTDTGCGMSEEVRARIFEPFFTTKDVGQGTGLGLSIVFRIVQNHGGRIEVRSTPGKGSEFSLHLPGRRPAGAALAA